MSPTDFPEPPPPPWRAPARSRGSRAPRATLDRDRIVQRALAIADAEGLDAVSFRRLADDLGVTPMSLYWHVADKAELLDLVGQAVMDGTVLPPRTGDWKADLRAIHRSMFEALLRHPNAAELVAGRSRFGRTGLAAFERILSILLEAGFGPVEAFDAYQALYLFTLGYITTSTRSPEFVAIQRQGVGYMLGLPEADYPSIRAVAPVIGMRPPAEQLDLGLDIVIEGIALRLAPRP